MNLCDTAAPSLAYPQPQAQPPAAAAARPRRRPVYLVLSPRSLGYAELALQTLLQNSADPLHLHLITDSRDDREHLRTVVHRLADTLPMPGSQVDVAAAESGAESGAEPGAERPYNDSVAVGHRWSLFAEADLQDAEAECFRRYPHLRRFRHGHPCWRKITDPLLLTAPGEEMVLLDPDLLFPNRFRFEPTPASGLLLMWQGPNCLLPPEVVRAALDAGVSLARHVDIGVAHWRLSEGLAELDWLEWLLRTVSEKLGGSELPRAMHVEAIVWAALAMQLGGGYLDPARWVCWHRTQGKRLRRKLGATGGSILQSEPWGSLKCFHAGGEAKWWLAEVMQNRPARHDRAAAGSAAPRPFVPLSPGRYACEQAAKAAVGRMGYYRLFGARA